MPASFSKVRLFPPAMLPACDIIFMCPVLTNKSFRQQRCRSQDRVGSNENVVYISDMSNGMHLMYFTHLKKTNEIKIFFIILFFLIYCNPFFCTDELCFEGACRKKWMKCGLLLSVLAWSRLLCTAHSPTHGPLCSVQLCEAPHSSLVPAWLKPRAYITETIWEHNCWITVFCVANI